MDVKNMADKIINGQPITEVLSPENYVFNRDEISNFFLRKQLRNGRSENITKTQLRKYFNEYKALYNLISINPNITQEEFENGFKRVLIVLPIMKSQNTFSDTLIKLVENVLKVIFNKIKKDYRLAIEDYLCFVNFYETLIAYSRDK